jgi:hypothetical protein
MARKRNQIVIMADDATNDFIRRTAAVEDVSIAETARELIALGIEAKRAEARRTARAVKAAVAAM